jgi:hypothetical protein
MRLNLALQMFALLAFLPLAGAQGDPEIDAIVASRLEPGEPADVVWEQSMAALERDYPAVARAVKQPNFVQQVSAAEEPSTQAFFAEMNGRNATALRVDGELYSVGITLGQSTMPPPGDGDTTDATDTDGTTGRGAPGLELGVVAFALAGLAIASRKT